MKTDFALSAKIAAKTAAVGATVFGISIAAHAKTSLACGNIQMLEMGMAGRRSSFHAFDHFR